MSSSSILDIPLEDVLYTAPALPASFEQAVLPVDKPLKWTSFDVIRKLRRVLGVRKMGHAGTLDPLATGLLIILVGRATKLMRRFLEMPKEYEGTLRLGETTETYDAEASVGQMLDASHVTDEDLDRVRRQFIGTITQAAPAYSAVKVGGERLYRKARRGEQVAAPKRSVTISSFELTGRDGNDVSFAVQCSKGTYIRSLAHDLGQALGVGAHLRSLRRTGIGPVSVDEAWTIEELERVLS